MKRTLLFGVIIFSSVVFFGGKSASAAGPTIVQTSITAPTTWTKSGSPYIIRPQNIGTLSVSSPLTIDPGVVVKFDGLYSGLSITLSGALTAIGTPDEKVVFTSFKDDTYGGDSNNDGSATTALKGEWYAIINSGTAVFDNATVLYGGSSAGTGAIFSYSNNLTVKNSTIRYAAYSGIALYNVSTAVIENNLISDNTTGIRLEKFVSGKIVTVSNNTIANNRFGATVAGITLFQMSVKLSAENNWWGDKSGPYYSPGVYSGNVFPMPANLSGKGNVVTDGVLFNPWLGSDPLLTFDLCAENCYSNVLFLPGLEASRLYIQDGSDENQLWEPNREADAEKLFLDENGKSIRDDVYTRDVIDEKNIAPIGQGNIYKSFLNDLEKWKNTDDLIFDYAVTPYDWRLSLDDILNSGKKTGENISYTESTASPYIIQELRRLAGTSKSGKVTLIAHSNGGLVAKALTDKLGAEAAELIDMIVLVAVPQSGTPQAIGALLHGYDQGLPYDWLSPILSTKTARTLANNMPSAYNLLPSDAYFSGEGSGVTTPVIAFEDGSLTNPFISKYGKTIDTPTELQTFLADDDGKVAPDANDTVSPSRINAGLLAYGENMHQAIDSNWSVPEGVSVYQIAGFGEETLGTIKYWTGQECLHEGGKICSSRVPKLEYTPELVVDGDGTVVAPSALAMSTSASNVKRYWVDLFDYNDVHIDRKHADILEIPQLRDFIKDSILTQAFVVLPAYLSTSTPPTNSEKRLRYFLHSPLALSAHNSAGQTISASEDTYPGATYRRFGEVQYISVPADSAPTLVLDGLDTGSFTLEVQEVTGEEVTETTTFSAIPTSSETEVVMSFSDGTIANASPLAVDYDGDGTIDFSLDPKPGETVVFDITPPVTAASVAGTAGMNDWYMSDVTVTFAVQDEKNGSGVAMTEYSLDNGVHWSAYTDPVVISQEGATNILYTSTDKQGNKEEMKTLSVKIDKTAPEAKIGFNPITQQLDIIGTDNLGQPVPVLSVESVIPDNDPGSGKNHWFTRWFHQNDEKRIIITTTLTDEAGHRTETVYEKKKDRDRRIDIALRSVSYDGIETVVPATLRYKWVYSERKHQYELFATSARAGGLG